MQTKFGLKINIDHSKDTITEAFGLDNMNVQSLIFEGMKEYCKYLASTYEEDNEISGNYAVFLRIFLSVASNIQEAMVLILSSSKAFSDVQNYSELIAYNIKHNKTNYLTADEWFPINTSEDKHTGYEMLGISKARFIELGEKGCEKLKELCMKGNDITTEGYETFISEADNMSEMYLLATIFSRAREEVKNGEE